MPWELGGNSGTDPSSNFLGTIDNQPLAIRTNALERMRITNDDLRILTGLNPILFSSSWKAFPDAPAPSNRAEISNDTGNFKTLMIVGNRSAGGGRRVSVWDRLEVNGDLAVTGDITLTNGDCAEEFDIAAAASVEPGTVMVIDAEGALKRSQQAYDKRVAGVVSGAGGLKPGIILDKGESNEGRLPVALMGKVACKVDARHSPIEVGDLLTTSPTLGYAMKATDHPKVAGAVLGKALRSLKEGQGLIPILVALH